MKNEWLRNGIDMIDDSLIEESLEFKRSRKPLYLGAGIAAAAVIISAAALNSVFRPEELSGTVPDGGPAAEETYAGGDSPSVLSDADITFTGTAIPEEDIREYLEKQKYLFASLAANETAGIDGDINISLIGHSYLKTSDNTIALDIVTYPIFIGRTVIAEITLFTSEGELYYTLSAGGGLRWEKINKALSEHPDESFVFLYTGVNSEYMIASDSTVYDLRSISEVPLSDNSGWYQKYYTEYNTFDFSGIIKDHRYITVRKEDIYE